MQIEFVPLLKVQRDLYTIPRGWERFRQYLAAMQPGTDEQLVPLFVMNPMAKEHVAARLDELLALDAEAAAEATALTAAGRLPHVLGDFKAGQVLADDIQGGWTNRYLSEAGLRFAYTQSPQKRARAKTAGGGGWVVGLLWVGEEPDLRHVAETMQAAVYRTVYIRRHGFPATLREMMVQEGLVLAFANAQPPVLDEDESAYSREVIRPHLDTGEFPVAFACLYGDAATGSVGYPALGLPEGAGFSVAYHAIQEYLKSSGETVEGAGLADGPRIAI